MSIDVVRAILCVVFKNEDSRVVPVRTVRYGVDHAAEGQIVICNVSGRTSILGTSTSSVIVW